jgi:hypothetical protein
MTDIGGPNPFEKKELTPELIAEVKQKADEWMPAMDSVEEDLAEIAAIEGEPEPTEDDLKEMK